MIIVIIGADAFALSGSRKSIEYDSCYTASVNDGETKSFAKAYCRCIAKKLDGNYTDQQLDALVNKGYGHMINEIRPLAKKCYDKAS